MRDHILLTSAATLAVAALPAAGSAQTAATPGAAGTAAGAPSESGPQTPSAGVEEIVVTAQKRTENIQNVPLSIDVVSGQALLGRGISDPVGLARAIPTLQITPGITSGGLTIRIRGFGSPPNSATDSDVADYVDSVFIPRPGAILTSFLDVKNVEVLSGPQGTLFGRNAAMGVVSITTNAPSQERSLDFSGEAGNYGTIAGSAIANLPVADNLALRFAFKGSHTDGPYFNLHDGKTYGASTGYVGRVSARWAVTPNVVLTLRADGSKTDGDGIYPQKVYVDTATPAQLAALSAFTAKYGGTPPVYSSPPSFTLNQVITNPFLHDKQWGITSDLSWSVSSAVTLRLIDSYRDWKNAQLTGDTAATTIPIIAVRYATRSKAQSHELQLVTPRDALFGGKAGITAGLFYFHEDYSLLTSFNMGSAFCPIVYGAAPPSLLAACQSGVQINAGSTNIGQTVDSLAGYAQVNYQLLSNVQLDLGARYTSDRKRGTLVSLQNNPRFVVVGPEGPLALRFSDSKPSFRGSLSWKPTDKILAFATISTGYKSGGFNSQANNPALGATARTFGSETVTDYELGTKSTFFDNKLRFNATLFDTELKNFQDRSFNGLSFVVRNAGSVRSRGLDVDGQFVPASRISISYALTYLDSIYTSDSGAPGLEGCTNLPGCPTVQDLTGQRLSFAPKFRGNLGAELRSGAFLGGHSATFGVSENFTSSFLTANTNNPQSNLPGYATTDIRVSLFSPSSKFQLDLFSQNLFDKHYFISTVSQVLGAQIGVNNPMTGASLFRGFLGDPRKWGARLSVRF